MEIIRDEVLKFIILIPGDELDHPFLGLLSCHYGKICYNSISENDEK